MDRPMQEPQDQPAAAAAVSAMPKLLSQVKAARSNLLTLLIFSVINIPLLIWGGRYFLFSFSSTQLLSGLMAEILADPEVTNGIQIMMVAIFTLPIVVILGVYLTCWICSKKRAGWLLVATVLFGTDCLLLTGMLLLSMDLSMLLDIAFHVFLMISLCRGSAAARQLKKLPPEIPCSPSDPETALPLQVDLPASPADPSPAEP